MFRGAMGARWVENKLKVEDGWKIDG